MTYKTARARILAYLDANHWLMSNPHLKTPHATHPTGKYRLWFKAQAVYIGYGRGTSLQDARSMHIEDTRNVSPAYVVEVADWYANRAAQKGIRR